MGDQTLARQDEGRGLRSGQLRTLDLWALAVGIVVCGQYFGWNGGLTGNGPVALLLASLLVCLLFLAWVLTLAELSVAMPDAGGPLAYGRRAAGPWLGFAMAWAMFLECLFGTVATALASGWYVAFLVDAEHPENHPVLIVAAGLGVVLLFFILQLRGVREQSTVLVWMTYAAIVGLVIYWIVALTNFAPGRVWTAPVLDPSGWRGVLNAVPYSLWWLIIIEGVALAAEETHDPKRTLPRGLVLAMLTIIVLIVLTLVLGCTAMPWTKIDGDYPLAKVVQHVLGERWPVVLYGFGAIALVGLLASYHGLLYSTSRQLYALGRDGYLPKALGFVHPRRRTPVVALLVCSVIAGAFVVASVWLWDAIKVAVLGAGLASLVWYVLAMGCLCLLRRRQPRMFRQYQAPLKWTLPLVVVLLSAFAIAVYPGIEHAEKVLPLMAGLYLLGLGYFAVWGRRQVRPVAAEDGVAGASSGETEFAGPMPQALCWRRGLDWLTVAVLGTTLLGLAWTILAAFVPQAVRFASDEVEAICLGALIVIALLLLCVVAWLHTRPTTVTEGEP